MKSYLKIIVFSFFGFIAINCASKKIIVKTQEKQANTLVNVSKKNAAGLPTKSVTIPEKIIEKQESEYLIDLLKTKKDYFPETNVEKIWVDSIYASLNQEQKIGQLFMVAAYSNKDEKHFQEIETLISKSEVGGLIFFQGGPIRQAKLTNRFQAKSNIPLFIGIDAEWGLNMRLDSTYKYPYNMTLGAIRDLRLIKKVGEHMANDSRRIGIHFNFSPVLDINTNAKNPIIGFRSFGEDKNVVTNHALALNDGLQSNGVFGTGKHFPGHGDTATDSHYALPLVNFSKQRLDSVELYPYKKMFENGLASVMVAHLNVPSLEPKENVPSSVSYEIVTNLLQKQLGFKGLIFTDALNMKAASKFLKPGEIDLEAFLAGNDILLFPENVPFAIEKIKDAILTGKVSQERLEFSVKKILSYKYKIGLSNAKPIQYKNIASELNNSTKDALSYQLYENAITVLKNEGDILPIKNLKQKIAYVKLGDDAHSAFLNTLKKYTEVTVVSDKNIDSLNVKLAEYETVIIGFHKADKAWKNHDFTAEELQIIDRVSEKNNVILDCFTRPYSLSAVANFKNINAVLVSYQNTEIAQIVSAQLLFGAIISKGQLPVSINQQFPVNFGLQTSSLDRLGFTSPINVGMSQEILNSIDRLANKAIDNKMTPGAQILVARRGKIIFERSYGYHTYEKRDLVKNSDIYDVASITKMVATLPNVMVAFDENKVGLETRLGQMLPEFQNTDKQNITFKELLSHHARLQPWIPFYKETLDSIKQPSEKYYRKTFSDEFPLQVEENLFLRKDYPDTIFNKIVTSKLLDRKEYKYSDFTFIILKRFLEKLNKMTLDQQSQNNFYASLGMNNTAFNPLRKFDVSRIPPTEYDTYYRNTKVQGYVHDMEAAMEGGVGGHAGVFSNSVDIAKMMQLFLQKGSYGGNFYFSPATFNIFNTCYFCAEGNRRGLGFDKPQLGKSGPTCGCVGLTSFGHTGFTGTMAWADPQSEIIYIFLSNRTFPDSNDSNKLSRENIREDIQKIIQSAILD
jgi:beta-glucosidase-like glycosyl hydrolase/CubicO group peptidase (beta-lactamase class C family)